MDYEKAYKLALERAKEELGSGCYNKGTIEYIFPELTESEDEKIRKAIIKFLIDVNNGAYTKSELEIASWIAWLEKQGDNNNQNWKPSKEQIRALEHFIRSIEESGYASPYDSNTKLLNSLINDLYKLEKQDDTLKEVTCSQVVEVGNGNINALVTEEIPLDKVEPKFKMEKGKWYVCDTSRYTDFIVGRAYYCPKNGMLKPNENEIARYVAIDCFHLWTIEDAKDGDVLVSQYDKPFIYNGNFDSFHIGSYCGISTMDRFNVATEKCLWTENVNIHPATKEQRELLFQKMKDAGYEWDEEKKELRKIEYKYEKSKDEEVKRCLINGMKFYYADNEEATWGTEKFSMKVKDILAWLEN